MKLIDDNYLDDFEAHALNAGAFDFAGDVDYVRYFHRDFLAYGFVDGIRTDIIKDFGADGDQDCMFGRVVWRELINDNGERTTPNVCVLWVQGNSAGEIKYVHMESLLNK